MTISSWFEKEEALIRAECEKRQISCIRDERGTIQVGSATIDLIQMQRTLDRTKTDSHSLIAEAWVDRAVLHQHAERPVGHISSVFPHIRPPSNRNDGPWGQLIANERLFLGLVYDEKNSLRYVRPLDIPTFSVGLNALQERATVNLRLATPDGLHNCVPHPEHADVWTVSFGDGHDAARLVIADQIAGMPVIAWIPHRDLLLFSTLNASDLGHTASALREECIQRAQLATHPISAEAFWVDGPCIAHLPFQKERFHGTLVPAGE